MNNKLMCVLAFSLGAAAGAAVSWKVIKTKYEQITRDEIESVKEYYRSRENDTVDSEETVECEDDDEDDAGESNELLGEYKDIALGYMAEQKETNEMKKPYVIPPEEYGEDYDYETETLLYYTDGVLADTDDNIISDVNGIVGYDSLNHFGEYEDDSVYVRNDRLKIDYEILRYEQTFDEVTRYNSYLDDEE